MNSWQILQGDVRDKLREIPDCSVQCCVTSPPYFGLRDYGMADQIGLEESPADYVATMVALFGEVRRTLKDDGVLWLNLGDSYAGSWGAQSRPQGETGEMAGRSVASARQIQAAPKSTRTGTVGKDWNCKPKDLLMIPATVALALRSAGWYLRADVVWAKPNPMPESITDRPTKSHEYVYLLTKGPRYFYDAQAIAEPLADGSMERYTRAIEKGEKFMPERHKSPRPNDQKLHRSPMQILTEAAQGVVSRGTRNKRTVWTIPTQPFAEAHFATMPEQLAETCILSGSRVGDCVLDPFTGSGTTAAVAVALGRSFVGVELNPEYIDIARRRISVIAPMFTQEIA